MPSVNSFTGETQRSIRSRSSTAAFADRLVSEGYLSLFISFPLTLSRIDLQNTVMYDIVNY